jgi:hypothetical protein
MFLSIRKAANESNEQAGVIAGLEKGASVV